MKDFLKLLCAIFCKSEHYEKPAKIEKEEKEKFNFVFQNNSKITALQNEGCFFVALVTLAFLLKGEKLTAKILDELFKKYSNLEVDCWDKDLKKMVKQKAVKKENAFVRNPDFILEDITGITLNSVLKNEKGKKEIGIIKVFRGSGYKHFCLEQVYDENGKPLLDELFDPWRKDGKGSDATAAGVVTGYRVICEGYYERG